MLNLHQKFPDLYRDTKPHLFIYYTTNNYASTGDYRGCYNLGCKGFVQTNRSIVIGGGYTLVSTVGGTQRNVTLEAYRDPATGHWWLRYGGNTWVGYYPNTLFSTAGLKNYGKIVEFGGEIIDDGLYGASRTDMGSGRWPSEGWTKAAYIKRIHYWGTNKANYETGFATFLNNAAGYYNVSSILSSTSTTWRKYFYYGGPGAP
jgi:hypothetical protein